MHKIILILLLPILGWSQNYLWPTNASQALSSSFGEYRPGHFHAGLDIKTWNREGYPCYAVDDGQIIKIRVSPFGYGKAIYLKLKDGRTAVYGHLQRFNKKLEKKIRARQIKNKRYSLTFNPGSIKVKKGEIIAYSGQTGIGVPHLHFEIRDQQGHPLNPLKFYKNKIKDHIAPKLLELLIIPRDANSRINGSFLPQSFSLKPTKNNNYIVGKPLYIKGSVGLALRGFDRADGVYNKHSCYRQTLRIADKKIFQARYDKIDFATTGQVDISIYYPLKFTSGRVFNKLFLEPYNDLPFFDRALGNGIIKMKKEAIPFTIEVKDYHGNRSRVSAILQPDTLAPAQLQIIRRINDFVLLNIQLPTPLKQLRFFTINDKGKKFAIEYFEILKRTFSGNSEEMLLKLKLRQSRAKAIGCLFSVAQGKDIQLVGQLFNDSLSRLKYKILNHGKFVSFSTQALPWGTKAKISVNKKNFMMTADQPNLERVLTAKEAAGDSLYFRIINGDKILADSVMFFHALYPGQKQSFRFFGDSLMIKSAEQTVYDTLLFSIKKKQAEHILLQQGTDERADSLFMQSAFYRLNIASQALRASLKISIKYEALIPKAEKLGIYRLNKKRKISFAGNKRDSVHSRLSAKTRSGGSFFVLADTIAPQLEMVYPKSGARLKSLNKIEFEAHDQLSGIGSETNLAIDIDGQFVIPEWDPERKRISGRPHWKVRPGKHTINISVSDRAGNTTTKSFEINIKE